MLWDKRYALIGLFLLAALLLHGCAPPYKIATAFYDRSNEIRQIGLYPLVYNEDGKEERLFGDTFNRIYYDGLMRIPLARPVELQGRAATISALQDAGYALADSIFVKDMSGVKFESYGYPSTEAFEGISGDLDAVIVPMLLNYNEASAGTQVTQMCLTTCLTGGLITASEENMLKMTLVLVDTETGQDLWTYTAIYRGELGEQRANYSEKVVNNFSKYFPFSATFEG